MKNSNIFIALIMMCFFPSFVLVAQVTQVFNPTGTIEVFEVPPGVFSLTIEVKGAAGGTDADSDIQGGLGAEILGTIDVIPGQKLKILVGQQGTRNGGGGGSFVVDSSTNAPLIIAGGGGGSARDTDSPSKHGQITTSGGAGAGGGGLGGTDGSGGFIGPTTFQSGAGGGLLTDGQNGNDFGGISFLNGGSVPPDNAPFGRGGFGGGGNGSGFVVGGGGGGYSGGGSGGNNVGGVGGGGGSFNAGTNQMNTAGVNSGDGMVTIQYTIAGSLPPGWSQDPNGVGCIGGNAIGFDPMSETWTATSTNCFYSSPFTSDASALAQFTLCGNGSITAEVTSISGTSLGWAGVVMRENNLPGAKKAQLTTNMSTFSRREFRTMTNGSATPQQFPSQNRRWLRIVRSGNQFVMYISFNGTTWSFAGAQNIQMNSCIVIGLVATNYSPSSTVTATFANVSAVVGNSLNMISSRDTSPQMDVADLQSRSDFRAYPNPTSGELNIALIGYENRPVSLEIYNAMGQLLHIKELDAIQNSDEILDLSQFTNGMYLIRVTSDGLPAIMKRVTLSK